MNDTDFQQRAYRNPWDNTENFQTALNEAPERQQLVEELQSLDQAFLVQPPANLRQQLLTLPGKNTSENREKSSQSGKATDTVTEKAATTPLTWASWHKALPLVASILLALSASFYFWPQSESSSFPTGTTGNPALSQTELSKEILHHIHSELDMLEADKPISLQQLNQRVDQYGAKLNADDMQVTDIKDCWVRGKALHLVMKSERGPVSVLIMGNAPVENEIPFEDDRFHGVIRPTPRGNLAIVSENEEGITEIQQILASNITW